MIFKSLVESILKRRRDPDDDLAFSAMSALTQELKTDLMQAFSISQPLVSKHQALFRGSRSYLDFLIKVSHLPHHAEHLAADDSARESRTDEGDCRRKECREHLETCKTELDTCKTELKTCKTERDTYKTELDTCKTERDTYKTELQNCDQKLKACETALQKREDELETCKTDLRKREDELEALQKERDELQFRLKNCESDLENSKLMMAKWSEENTSLELADKSQHNMEVVACQSNLQDKENQLERMRVQYENDMREYFNHVNTLWNIIRNLEQHYVQTIEAANTLKLELKDTKHKAELDQIGGAMEKNNFLEALNRLVSHTAEIEQENKNLKELESKKPTCQITDVSDASSAIPLPPVPSSNVVCLSQPSEKDVEMNEVGNRGNEIINVLREHYTKIGCDDENVDDFIMQNIRYDLESSKRLRDELDAFKDNRPNRNQYFESVKKTKGLLDSVLEASQLDLTEKTLSEAVLKVNETLQRCHELVLAFPPLATVNDADLSAFYGFMLNTISNTKWEEPIDLTNDNWFRYATIMIQTMLTDLEFLNHLMSLEPKIKLGEGQGKCEWKNEFVSRYNKMKDCVLSLISVEQMDEIDKVLTEFKQNLSLDPNANPETPWLGTYINELRGEKSTLADKVADHDDFYEKLTSELDILGKNVPKEKVFEKLNDLKNIKRSESTPFVQSKKLKKEAPLSDIEVINLFCAFYKEYFILKWKCTTDRFLQEPQLKNKIKHKLDILGDLPKQEKGGQRVGKLLKILKKYVEYDLMSLQGGERIPQIFTDIVSKDELLLETMEHTESYLKTLMGEKNVEEEKMTVA